MELEAVIGLEVHVQLKTASKMFCRCDNRDGQTPNTAICPVCTGQPGTLPLPNDQAIRWALMTALALGCTINQESKFDRKNYFYPDLPKGYQISQYDRPFGYDGKVAMTFDGRPREFRIHRLHLEEDAGKLLHPAGREYSLVDLNRAGTPLLEIVSEPDFRSPAEAKAYLQEIQLVMRYLGVSDANMEKGHLRCDANISLRPVGDEQFYPKTEIKNLNSFKAVERALAYEITRQSGLWAEGRPPPAGATRGWDEAGQKTVAQRTKEEAADYRYFPEPDIPPIIVSNEFLLELRGLIPELPAARRARLHEMHGLSQQSDGLVADKELAEYFEEVVSEYRAYADSELGAEPAEKLWTDEGGRRNQKIANWLINRLSVEHRAAHGLDVPPADVARLLWLLDQNVINAPSAATVYEQMVQTKKGPHQLVQDLGLEQVSDSGELEKIVNSVIATNPNVVTDYKAGKTAASQFLAGQVMKATKGKANPQVVRQLLEKALGTDDVDP